MGFDKSLRRPTGQIVDDEVVAFDGTSGLTKSSGVDKDNIDTSAISVPSKATNTELNTGTDDAKFATALGLTNSNFTKAGPAGALTANFVPSAPSARNLGGPTYPFGQVWVSQWLGLKTSAFNISQTAMINIVSLVTTGASDRTLTLPDSQKIDGRFDIVIKVDSGAGAVILAPATGLINGAATLRTTQQYAGALIITDGSTRYALLFGTWT